MTARNKAPENPYMVQYHAARREWNERYGDLIQAKRNWQLTAFGSLTLAALLGLGLIWQGAQSRIVRRSSGFPHPSRPGCELRHELAVGHRGPYRAKAHARPGLRVRRWSRADVSG
jgi:hypothetical protein